LSLLTSEKPYTVLPNLLPEAGPAGAGGRGADRGDHRQWRRTRGAATQGTKFQLNLFILTFVLRPIVQLFSRKSEKKDNVLLMVN
jgi:hypothetical protein